MHEQTKENLQNFYLTQQFNPLSIILNNGVHTTRFLKYIGHFSTLNIKGLINFCYGDRGGGLLSFLYVLI